MLSRRWLPRGVLPSVTAVAIGCGTAAGFGAAAATPKADDSWRTPDGVVTTELAGDLRIDGAHARVQLLRSAAAPAAVLESWRRLWEASGHPAIAAEVGGWRIVSRPVHAGLLTVQARAGKDGGTIGYVALTSTRGANPRFVGPLMSDAARRPKALTLPAASVVLRSVESTDRGRAVTQTVVRLRAGADAAMRAFAGAARAAGWVEQLAGAWGADVASGSPARDRARVRWFARGSEALAVFVTNAEADALVVLDHVRPDSRALGAGG